MGRHSPGLLHPPPRPQPAHGRLRAPVAHARMHPLTLRPGFHLPVRALPQWASKACDVREACVRVYTAARPVLAAIHDAPLQ